MLYCEAMAGVDRELITRSQFLRAAGAAGAMLAVGGTASAKSSPRHVASFVSRPDLRPPVATVTSAAAAPATAVEGLTFLGPTSGGGAQAGPLILDAAGEPVWFKPLPAGTWATNFRVQQYRGEPVLTWWEGKVLPSGYGQGEGVIVDSSYREVARVRAGHGQQADLHEFLLTPQGTALITCYPQLVTADTSSLGGITEGHAYESIIQEVSVGTGKVLLDWRSLDHVSVSESYVAPWAPCDYLHANSIELTHDGHLLVSARSTWALYKLNRRSGEVVWRLGGKRSNFKMGPRTRFSWQHDARAVGPGTITLFDDGAGVHRTEYQSRGLVLAIDEVHRTVKLAQSFRHPSPLLAFAMGNMQTLPDGNVTIGWGTVPWVSEFAADGTLIGDVRLGSGHDTYRGYRLPWTGTPVQRPVVATRRSAATGAVTLYVSWNGATEVATWQASAGASPGALAPLVEAPRDGFETAIPLGVLAGYTAVTALDAGGRALATSAPQRV